MPIYEVGLPGGGGGGTGGGVGHFHSGWEAPIQESLRQFRVNKGNYQSGELSVAISAESEGEEGFTDVHPPAYQETNPSDGIFTLAQDLPGGWRIKVKYTYI